MTDCTPSITLKQRVKRRVINIHFDGGDINGDAGLVLIKTVDERLGLLESISQVLQGPRDPGRIRHSVHDLLKQRVYALAAGYADLNDHQQLRIDAAVQTAVGSLQTLASPATLCRFESQVERKTIVQMHEVLLEQFIAAHDTPPESLILDFDGTDDRVYGEQQGRHFNSHYGGYCFFPLYVYCGEHLLVSYLRSSDRGDSHHAAAVLSLRVVGLRRHWPRVQIIFRGDAGFYSPLLLGWCERHDVAYVIGFGGNAKLKAFYATEIDCLSGLWEVIEKAGEIIPRLKVFYEQDYRAKSWKRDRRVIAKLEHNACGGNQRYIVTTLTDDAEHVYSTVYCQRGEMENRHKEMQMALFADRTSSQAWWSNQLRVMLSSLAYTLMQALRRLALTGTQLARAQVWTIREKLIKIGAVILRNTRRIELRMSSACVYQKLFIQALTRLDTS